MVRAVSVRAPRASERDPAWCDVDFLDLQFRPLLGFIPELGQGLVLTIVLAIAGVVLGGGLGLALAIWRFMVPRRLGWLAWPVTAYVELIRNTPLLVQLYIIFLGLPTIGLRLSPLEASVLGMTLNLGAYSTEIFRAGFESIKKPQIEAGLSLGLSRLQVMRHVVLVPAVASVWPSLMGQFILMMLGTSICSFISLEEISGTAYNIQSETFLNFEVYLVIGAMYLVLTMAMKASLGRLGQSLFVRQRPRRTRRAAPEAPVEVRE